jgi:CDP-diacylglycerol--serine O-phosphatidyltransferase
VFAAGAALRLARFNTQSGSADKRFFQGLPSPPAAAVIAGMVWFGADNGFPDGTGLIVFTFPITIITGLLMVSKIRYHSFKELDLHGRVPFVAVLIVVLVFVFIASEPPLVLFLLALVYAAHGPAMTLAAVRQRRALRRGHDETHQPPQELPKQ